MASIKDQKLFFNKYPYRVDYGIYNSKGQLLSDYGTSYPIIKMFPDMEVRREMRRTVQEFRDRSKQKYGNDVKFLGTHFFYCTGKNQIKNLEKILENTLNKHKPVNSTRRIEFTESMAEEIKVREDSNKLFSDRFAFRLRLRYVQEDEVEKIDTWLKDHAAYDYYLSSSYLPYSKTKNLKILLLSPADFIAFKLVWGEKISSEEKWIIKLLLNF